GVSARGGARPKREDERHPGAATGAPMNPAAPHISPIRFRAHLTAIVSSVELLLHPGAAHTDAQREELIRVIETALERIRDMLGAAALALETRGAG
ncbi:MAG TPA: hypothetical protein VD970_07605, partial [Acetobacteraceae bacterium]|nr:hypothetical protein [Acetobacteraceae bacterium]